LWGCDKVDKKAIIIGIIIILIALTGFYIYNANRALKVDWALVEKGDIEKYIEELGIVVAKDQGNIYSSAAGRVIEILVNIGEEIKKGDILVKLDNKQIQKEIQVLESERAIILAQYDEAKEKVDEESIEKLELTIGDMERKVQRTKEIVDNNKTLYEAGAISHEEYKESLQNLEMEKSNLEKARLDLQALDKPISQNIISQYEARLRQIDIQKEKLRDLDKDFTIVSNADGIVLRQTIEEGSYIQPGMDIMEIGNTEELYIESDILVDDIVHVREGAKVRISNKNIGLKDLEGAVKKIYPYAFNKVSDLGVEQRRIQVDIEMKDFTADIRPGYDLDIRIITDNRTNTILIPKKALFDKDGKHFVFINSDGRAQIREVKKGIEDKNQIEILDGLEKGDIVILTLDERIKEGTKVKHILQKP